MLKKQITVEVEEVREQIIERFSRKKEVKKVEEYKNRKSRR